MGYIGVGRSRNAQKRWDEAIEQFNCVAILYNDYSPAYSFRAEAYIGKEKWTEATDDILKALIIDSDDKAFFLMQNLEEPAFGMMKAKMKIQGTKEPNNPYWPYCIGVMHEQNYCCPLKFTSGHHLPRKISSTSEAASRLLGRAKRQADKSSVGCL